MVEASYLFPEGFLWGSAASSHQFEGGNTNNNWHVWEGAPGHIQNGDVSGLATDWWGGRWQEDFDRAAEAGQNAIRFSLEWSRVQPEPGRWDAAALECYAEMARGAVQRGLTPMVTLHHFTNPLWFEELGGWEGKQAPKLFEAYVRKVVPALQDRVKLWCTINEPNVLVVVGYIIRYFPPGVSSPARAFRVAVQLARAHARAYRAIHALQAEAQVGMAFNYRGIRPQRPWFPPDRWMARLQTTVFSEFFPNILRDGRLRFLGRSARIPEAKGTQDYFGLNYYTDDEISFTLDPRVFFGRRRFPEGAEVSENNFMANTPDGFYRSILWAHGFGLPIHITENGIEDASDHLRPRYLAEQIHQVWRAVNISLPVRSYFHWALVDNFEWDRGWTQRFGLWELDIETQARRKRPSADLYAAICRANGLSSEMVRKWAPEAFERLFPV